MGKTINRPIKNYLLILICVLIVALNAYLLSFSIKKADTSIPPARAEIKKIVEYTAGNGKEIKLMVDFKLINDKWNVVGMEVVE